MKYPCQEKKFLSRKTGLNYGKQLIFRFNHQKSKLKLSLETHFGGKKSSSRGDSDDRSKQTLASNACLTGRSENWSRKGEEQLEVLIWSKKTSELIFYYITNMFCGEFSLLSLFLVIIGWPMDRISGLNIKSV